jgi:serine/threonine protein phosphatase PrpC
LEDQTAVDLVAGEKDPHKAAMKLRDYAFMLESRDNISVVIVRLK